MMEHSSLMHAPSTSPAPASQPPCCCSALIALTVALSATQGSASRFSKPFDFKARAKGISKTNNHEDGDKSFSHSKSRVVGGFSACASKSWAGAASSSKHSYAKASMPLVNIQSCWMHTL